MISYQSLLLSTTVLSDYYCACMRERGKAIVLYVCRHEIYDFAESLHLVDAYTS